ncbi:MAG: ABC transporter permease, partial [Lachnospiraceae bacterium]|nr:ABC transporter permease [Lachnospiraceae bacterium]
MNNKKIIFQVTKTYMKKRPRRTFITFLGIVAMVVMMTAVFVGKDTVLEFMASAVAADKGSWHAQVYDVDKTEAEEIMALPYITDTAVSRSLGFTDFPQTGNKYETPWLELKGYSGYMFDWMNIRVKEGRLPENDHEILLSERAIKEGADIKVGDTVDVDTFERSVHAFLNEHDSAPGSGYLRFSTGLIVHHGETVPAPSDFPYYEDNDEFEVIKHELGNKGTYTIVGIMEMPSFEKFGQAGYVALVKTEPVIPAGDKVNLSLKIDLKKNSEPYFDIHRILNSHRTPEEIEKMTGQGQGAISKSGEMIPAESGRVYTNDILLTFSAKSSDSTVNTMMIFFQAFFLVLIVAASMVLIYNVFNISFRERSRYLGMLASVGATKSQKKWSVYYEIFVLLIFALPIGILLGLLVVKGGMALLFPHFRSIISTISVNVITGRALEVGYHVIVRPFNIIAVVVFSVFAVWTSAMLPAKRISKVGPVEGIRGNVEIGSKKHRTGYRFMKRGNATGLLAMAGTTRNAHSTRGIIGSITAFIAVSVITAFGMNMITTLVDTKADNSDLNLGSVYKNYEYVLAGEGEQYLKSKEEVLASDELKDYKESRFTMFSMNVWLDNFTDEYKKSLAGLIGKYYPEGLTDEAKELYFGSEECINHPTTYRIVLTDEDFASLAKRAGLSATGLEETPTALVYDMVQFSTDDMRIDGEGTVAPEYALYQIKKPLNMQVGDSLGAAAFDYDKWENVALDLNFGGYVSAEDVEELYGVKGKELTIFVSETAEKKLLEKIPEIGPGIVNDIFFFNVKDTDGTLLRSLANVTDEYGNSVLQPATLLTGYTDLKKAIAKIVKIVTVCFTLLVSVVCMLNLYNSVMGRKIERHKELSVLRTVGTTEKQIGRILTLENLRLLARSLIYSVVISGVFVISLHRIVSWRFGKVLFRLPVGITVLIVA